MDSTGRSASVVLIHGAWHGAWCWDGVVKALGDRGIAADAVQLPLTGFADDVAVARAAIAAAGEGCVVCAHSYGGAVVAEAAGDLTGINRLVFLTALMLETGEDLYAMMLAEPTRLHSALVMAHDAVTVDPAAIRDALYADSPVAVTDAIIPLLRPMPVSREPIAVAGLPAWKHIPSTYVVCTNDQAMHPKMQRLMAARADEVVEWPTDHSPFLTRPAELAGLLTSYL